MARSLNPPDTAAGLVRRLDNVGIAVRDLERALRFYVEVLGLGLAQPYEPGQRGNAVLVGDAALYLFETDHAEALGRPAARRGLELYQNPVGLDHLVFEVDDLGVAAAALERRGVRFEAPTVEAGDLRYRAFSDPDGNILYLLERRARPAR
jgi:catechol 2,3-dioxygenase-like lactoylglutathione lyase family enzyme